MNRGVLMSKEGQKGIVLTHDGSFTPVRLKDTTVVVGQEISDAHIFSSPIFKKVYYIPAMAACMSVVLAMVLFLNPFQNSAVAAYVSFDVNPSLEAAVTNDMKIVDVKAINTDAKAILSNIENVEDMALSKFVGVVVDAFKEQGYLNEGANIVVSAAVTDVIQSETKEKYLDRISDAVRSPSDSQMASGPKKVEFIQTTMEFRNKAKHHNMTAGKYYVYMNAKERDGTLSVNAAKDLSISEIKNFGKDVKVKMPKTKPINKKSIKMKFNRVHRSKPGKLVDKVVPVNTAANESKKKVHPSLKHDKKVKQPKDNHDKTLHASKRANTATAVKKKTKPQHEEPKEDKNREKKANEDQSNNGNGGNKEVKTLFIKKGKGAVADTANSR